MLLPERARAPRVLVVEDDESTRTFVRRVLGRAGFTVAVVASAESAMPLLGQQEWQALLTELNLPGTSGLELARIARTGWPTLRVAVMTDDGSPAEQAELGRLGIGAVMAKPLLPAALVAGVASLVGPPSPGSPA